MFDPHTSLEELSRLCKTEDDFREMLTQCEQHVSTHDSFDENVAIPSPLLHEAMEKTANLCTVTTREVQKILHVGYPLAEQIRCELCKIKSKTTG